MVMYIIDCMKKKSYWKALFISLFPKNYCHLVQIKFFVKKNDPYKRVSIKDLLFLTVFLRNVEM